MKKVHDFLILYFLGDQKSTSKKYKKSLTHRFKANNRCFNMENENEPFLVDYYCPQKRQFNFKAYYEAEENFDRNRKEQRKVAKPKKRPFRNRNTYKQRDPKLSYWYIDHMID